MFSFGSYEEAFQSVEQALNELAAPPREVLPLLLEQYATHILQHNQYKWNQETANFIAKRNIAYFARLLGSRQELAVHALLGIRCGDPLESSQTYQPYLKDHQEKIPEINAATARQLTEQQMSRETAELAQSILYRTIREVAAKGHCEFAPWPFLTLAKGIPLTPEEIQALRTHFGNLGYKFDNSSPPEKIRW